MNKEKEIRVELFRVEGDIAPFVNVEYFDKNKQKQNGLFLLDSGSSVNVLSSDILEKLGMLYELEDEATTIASITENVIKSKNVRFFFTLEESVFSDVFCISNDRLPIKIKGHIVLGILGIRFMRQFHLALDYSDFSLHTSKVCPENLRISDCVFFFPMEIGLNLYSVPVVSVKQNGKEMVALVDTGATNNIIAKTTLTDNDFRYHYLEEKDIIKTVTGNVEVEDALVWFNLMSLKDDDVCEISRHARFSISPSYIYTPKGGDGNNELPPIEMLIGAPFIANEGWILDFGANIMYKLQSANIETFASADMIKCAIKDEQRVLYSPDGKWAYGTAHKRIKSYSFRPGTEIISDRAFWFSTSTHSFVIPEGVIAIGKHAFYACHSLQTIQMPSTIEHIGEGLFLYCENLKYIIIPKGTRDKFEKLLSDYKDLLVEK